MSIFTKLTVATSVLAIATIGTAFSAQTAHADEKDTPVQTTTAVDKNSDEAITEKAKQVILGIDDEGKLVPTGAERVVYLTSKGYDAEKVQNKVNDLLNHVVVNTPVAQVTPSVVETPVAEQAPVAQTEQAPVAQATYASGDTSAEAAAQQMAARTGVSADQWMGVIQRESGGNSSAVNASSGAYGYFQLLGHGEYAGMSVQEQIDMAVQVYQSQGADAWVAW